ncbi:MAG: glycosyltransferase, partial [Mucilaginibacter sp.]
MNVAIISYNHPESSLVLAKHLAEFNNVHYYYITDLKRKSIPGIGYLSNKNFRVGLSEITLEYSHPVYYYLNNVKIKITVIAYPTFRPQFKRVNEFLTAVFMLRVKKNYYDAINIIGQQELLISFYKALNNYKIVHSLHEVAKHYEGQELRNKLLNFLYTRQVPIIVHSDNSYERLMEQYPFSRDRVIKIPFGLFETYKFFSNGLVQEEQNAILFYGFIKPYKGLETFIKAVKYAREKLPNIKGIIAGGGFDPALATVEDDKTFNVINRFLDNDEIAAFNQQATVVVCPYTS